MNAITNDPALTSTAAKQATKQPKSTDKADENVSASKEPQDTVAAKSPQEIAVDQNVSGMVKEDLDTKSADEEARQIKNLLASQNLSLANANPEAIQQLF